jgi:hypothetical protein
MSPRLIGHVICQYFQTSNVFKFNKKQVTCLTFNQTSKKHVTEFIQTNNMSLRLIKQITFTPTSRKQNLSPWHYNNRRGPKIIVLHQVIVVHTTI